MVGPPKTLYDLRRIEAAVQVTCRACRRRELRDREQTILLNLSGRRSTDWRTYCDEARCAWCHSEDVAVIALPFAENNAEMRARRAAELAINLALDILTRAARRDGGLATDGSAVRLALRVLHQHVGDQALLVTFWHEANSREARAYNGAQQAVRWITQRLLDREHAVWAEFR